MISLQMQQSPAMGANALQTQNVSGKNFKLANSKQKLQELVPPFQEPLPEVLRSAFDVKDALPQPQVESLPTTLSNTYSLNAPKFGSFPNHFMAFAPNAMPFPAMSASKGSDMPTSQMTYSYGPFLQPSAFSVQPNMSEVLRDHTHAGQRDITSQADKGPGALDEENHMAMKRPRLIWTHQLHERFIQAVNKMGVDQAVPKAIMQLMNVKGITRENVASHLQKYRAQLKKVQAQEKVENASAINKSKANDKKANI